MPDGNAQWRARRAELAATMGADAADERVHFERCREELATRALAASAAHAGADEIVALTASGVLVRHGDVLTLYPGDLA